MSVNKPEYIYSHLDKIGWKILSSNPAAINILENNLDKIDWYYL